MLDRWPWTVTTGMAGQPAVAHLLGEIGIYRVPDPECRPNLAA